ncbi:hypothetical protein ACHAWF_016087 [Thalassiosira exigua]
MRGRGRGWGAWALGVSGVLVLARPNQGEPSGDGDNRNGITEEIRSYQKPDVAGVVPGRPCLAVAGNEGLSPLALCVYAAVDSLSLI